MGSVHRSQYADPWELAEPGGTRNRSVRQAVPGEAPARRYQDPSSRSPCLEPANQSKTHDYRLDVRSQEGQEEVQVQVQNQAVLELDESAHFEINDEPGSRVTRPAARRTR